MPDVYKTSQKFHRNAVSNSCKGLGICEQFLLSGKNGQDSFPPWAKKSGTFFFLECFSNWWTWASYLSFPEPVIKEFTGYLENLIGSCAHFTEHRAQSLIIVNYLLSWPSCLSLNAWHIVIFIAGSVGWLCKCHKVTERQHLVNLCQEPPYLPSYQHYGIIKWAFRGSTPTKASSESQGNVPQRFPFLHSTQS